MPKFKKDPDMYKQSGFKMNYTDGKKASPEKFFGGLRGILGGRKKGRGFLSRILDPAGLHEKGGILSGMPKPFGHLRGEKGIGGWKGGILGGGGVKGGILGMGGAKGVDASAKLARARKKFGGKFF